MTAHCRPSLALRLAIAGLCGLWMVPGVSRAQVPLPSLQQVVARFDVGFDSSTWEAAAADLEALLDSGALSRPERSQARKYLAQYHMLVTHDNPAAVEIYKDVVADDPSFGMEDLALGGSAEAHDFAVRLFGEALLKWRQEELERRAAALRATSRMGALTRSLVLPGTGQLYQGYGGRGYGMMVLTGGAVAFAVVSKPNYRSARDDYDDAGEGADFDRLYRDYETAANRADIAQGVVAAAWLYNVLDAALSGPNLAGLTRDVMASAWPSRDGSGARLQLALAF